MTTPSNSHYNPFSEVYDQSKAKFKCGKQKMDVTTVVTIYSSFISKFQDRSLLNNTHMTIQLILLLQMHYATINIITIICNINCLLFF